MWEIFFLKNHAKNETRRLVPDLLCFEVKGSGFSTYFDTPQPWYTAKTKWMKFHTIDPKGVWD